MAVRFLHQKKFSTRKHKIGSRVHFVVAKRLCSPMIFPLGRHGESFSSLKQPEKLWGSLCLRGLFQSYFPKGKLFVLARITLCQSTFLIVTLH